MSAVINGHTRLSSEQLAVVLTLEAQAANLQTAANQLGGFLKQEGPANALIAAMHSLDEFKTKYLEEAAHSVVLARPDDIPRLVTK